MIDYRRKTLGVSLAGFLPFLVFIGMLGSAVVISTSNGRKASGDSIKRLQTHAAAEGVALLLSKDSATTGTIALGSCLVEVASTTPYDNHKDIILNVRFNNDIHKRHQDTYVAVLENPSTGTTRLKGVYRGTAQ